MNNNTNNENKKNKTIGVKRRILAGVCAGTIGVTGYMFKDKFSLKSNKAFCQTMISTLDEKVSDITENVKETYINENDLDKYTNAVPIVFKSDMEYNHSITEDNGRFYVSEGTILKSSPDRGGYNYFKILGLCDSKVDDCSLNLVNFNSNDFYIDRNMIGEFAKFRVSEVDTASEYSYIRSNPSDKEDNIIGKLNKDDYIYSPEVNVNIDDENHNWRQVIIEDKENSKVTYGYIDMCSDNTKLDLDYVMGDSKRDTYIYIIKDTCLYTDDDIDNMYYRVLPKDGMLLYKDENFDSNDAVYLPQNTILKNCEGIYSGEDYNFYLKCSTESESGELLTGYVLYRKVNNVFLRRTTEDILQEKNAQLTK